MPYNPSSYGIFRGHIYCKYEEWGCQNCLHSRLSGEDGDLFHFLSALQECDLLHQARVQKLYRMFADNFADTFGEAFLNNPSVSELLRD